MREFQMSCYDVGGSIVRKDDHLVGSRISSPCTLKCKYVVSSIPICHVKSHDINKFLLLKFANYGDK